MLNNKANWHSVDKADSGATRMSIVKEGKEYAIVMVGWNALSAMYLHSPMATTLSINQRQPTNRTPSTQ